MRAEYDRRPRLPRCPDCGAAHLPALRGDGARVWCGGSPAETPTERAARERADDTLAEAIRQRARLLARVAAERAERKRAALRERARLRRERAKREGPPVDSLDRARFRAALAALPEHNPSERGAD